MPTDLAHSASATQYSRIQDVPQHLPFPQPDFEQPGDWARWAGEIAYEMFGPGVCNWPAKGHDPNDRRFIAVGGELLY